jgi:peptidoglycan/xylan/chitin deacetylase (PgdA/CDA1 family)
MKRLHPGWYIILYHDISWEENCYLRSIGGTCPPDVFRQHLCALTSLGDFVSVADGERLLRENAIDGPIFSFWFDDGLAGVSRHAMPILDEFNLTGAVSICSRFVRRTEFFWRFKLSYLNYIDGIRFLRSRLQNYGFRLGDSVKNFTLDNFSEKILEDINELFVRFTTPAQREDAYRIFLDREAVRLLYDRGWDIVNHSAGHYPISQEHSLSLLCPEFQECEAEIQDICRTPSRYWVLPFDANTSQDVVRAAGSCRGDRYLVFIGSRRNTAQACNPERILFRFAITDVSAESLINRLSST